MSRIGIVTGLADEAACLSVFAKEARPAVRPAIRCAGASAGRAADAARLLVQDGCAGLVSFGICGGLSPDAPPGTVLLPDVILAPTGHGIREMATDSAWRERVAAVLERSPKPLIGTLIGSTTPAATPRDKRRLWQASRACAVDMESFAVGRVAGEAGVPCLVVRVVADPWDRPIPPWLITTVDREGGRDAVRLALGLLKRPWDVPAMVAVGVDYQRALRILRRVAVRLGPLFQFDG